MLLTFTLDFVQTHNAVYGDELRFFIPKCAMSVPRRQNFNMLINKPRHNALILLRNIGRGDRIRTCDPRFWRPMLYQLSYTPAR